MSTKQTSGKGVHVLNSVEERKKFRSKLNDVAAQHQMIADRREVIKEAVAEISEEYGIDKKYIRRLATTIFKSNYNEQQASNRAFEAFYEIVFEGSYRDDPEQLVIGAPDPLDTTSTKMSADDNS